MANAVPSIACLGVIGRNNNPLHTTILPSHDPATNTYAPVRSSLQFSLLLSSTLDVFAARARHAGASNLLMSGDFGLLHAVDERLAAYGFETNTGVKFVAVVDMRGRPNNYNSTGGSGSTATGGGGGATGSGGAKIAAGGGGGGVGLREGELKPLFRAMQTAYVRLLQNPFYDPEEAAPGMGKGGRRITSRKFGEEMRRIGEAWAPGVTSL
ncbi:Longin-like domain-containing protein [Xylariaceae sp. FL0016]|nr:Longin-like domain-containing protein [Xylariaceae sp. FL0016]